MRAHRALADVLMTCELWKHLCETLKGRFKDRAIDLEVLMAVMKKPKAAMKSFLDSLATGCRADKGLLG